MQNSARVVLGKYCRYFHNNFIVLTLITESKLYSFTHFQKPYYLFNSAKTLLVKSLDKVSGASVSFFLLERQYIFSGKREFSLLTSFSIVFELEMGDVSLKTPRALHFQNPGTIFQPGIVVLSGFIQSCEKTRWLQIINNLWPNDKLRFLSIRWLHEQAQRTDFSKRFPRLVSWRKEKVRSLQMSPYFLHQQYNCDGIFTKDAFRLPFKQDAATQGHACISRPKPSRKTRQSRGELVHLSCRKETVVPWQTGKELCKHA